MLVFGYGITSDIEHIRFAVLDYDQSPESHAYIQQFEGSSVYFTPTSPAASDDEALERLKADDVSLVLELPPNFGRDYRRGSKPEVLGQVDAAMTFRGDTVAQYVQGVHNEMLKDGQRSLCKAPEI